MEVSRLLQATVPPHTIRWPTQLLCQLVSRRHRRARHQHRPQAAMIPMLPAMLMVHTIRTQQRCLASPCCTSHLRRPVSLSHLRHLRRLLPIQHLRHLK